MQNITELHMYMSTAGSWEDLLNLLLLVPHLCIQMEH